MPQSPSNPQWNLRLDRYHRFVVEKFVDAFETDRSAILVSWITQWVADHPEQVEQAGASIADWKASRDLQE